MPRIESPVAIPDRIRRYLSERGISDATIERHSLGWNGERITIPIFDEHGELAYHKLAKAPDDHSDSPKMLLPPGAHAELYGWENVQPDTDSLVICEGEFDRLLLESQGFAAATSTTGAGVFKPEWAAAIRHIPHIYVCFDRDDAGRKGAAHVATLLPAARIVDLPEEVGDGGDVTDYFVRLQRSASDFAGLLEQAMVLPAGPRPAPTPVTRRRAAQDDIAQLKDRVPIERVVSRYLALRPRGSKFLGRCPFHEDRTPSFYVYSPTHYHCFGCEAHGDVITFLRRKENLTYPEAVDLLRRFDSGS